MTKLSYTIATVNGKNIKTATYSEMLKIKSENPGCKVTTTYEPIPEKPTPMTDKKRAARVKATL